MIVKEGEIIGYLIMINLIIIFINRIINLLKLYIIKLLVCFVKIIILIGGGIFEMLDLFRRFYEMNNFFG